MTLKKALHQKCETFITKRFDTIQRTILDLQNSLVTETKSSAGDKHETGRAMLQLEREKAGQQLAIVENVKQILAKIDVTATAAQTRLGSVVYTNKANYYIAISAGVLKVENDEFYAVSAATPIAKCLLGKKAGDHITFAGQSFKILKVI
jgi:transcription elongation GreA/GreB family factor